MGRTTRWKKRTAACFSNSRAAESDALLSKSSATWTGVSERVSSPMVLTSPSIFSSKSSTFKSVMARPKPSTTEAGMMTRFESTRTTSSSSTSSGVCEGAGCGCGVEAGVGAACGCAVTGGVGDGCGAGVSFGATVRRGRT